MHPALIVLFLYLVSIVVNVFGIRYCNKINTLPVNKVPVGASFLSVILLVYIIGTISEHHASGLIKKYNMSNLKKKIIDLYNKLNDWCNYP